MPIEEDEHGTYIMNSKDNCLIEHLKELRDAGVCSFKVEGRNKTEYYLAVVAKAYRKAIDDMTAGRKFDRSLLEELEKVSNRGYIPGFLKGFPGNSGISSERSAPSSKCRFVGIIKWADGDLYRIEMRNRVEVGEEVEVVMPEAENLKVKLKEILNLKKEPVKVAHGGDKDVYFRLKKGVSVGAVVRIDK
jgi:putative protease